MLLSIARTQSARISRTVSSKLPVFSRLSAASFSSFHGSNLPKSNKNLSLTTSFLNSNAIRKYSASVSTTEFSAEDLKSELSVHIGFNGPTGTDAENAKFLEHLMNHYKVRKNVPKEFLVKLLDHSLKHQLTLPNVLRIFRNTNPDDDSVFDGNLTIVGDVHGQYDDFAQIFQQSSLGGYPNDDNQFIFNGDLVDRGPMALEIVTVLLVAKLLSLNSVHILRGNHETHSMTQAFGFEKEVLKKYDRDLLDKFRVFFDALPIAAVVENKVFVVHGGIGPQVVGMTLNEIDDLNRVGEPDYGGPISELLWSDPKEKLQGFRANGGRGGNTVCFGEDVTKAFLVNNRLNLVVRSHEVMMQGAAIMHDGLLLSLFSAPNYCGDTGNLGAVARFMAKDSMNMSIIQFPSVLPMKRPKNFPPQ